MHSSVVRRGSRDTQISWRYATAADVRAYYDGESVPTMRAIMVFMDDDLAGIIGIAREDWTCRFFSEFREELKPFLNSITVLRAIKKAMEFVNNYPADVFARAQHDEGCRVLQRLGFKPTENSRTFVWEN